MPKIYILLGLLLLLSASFTLRDPDTFQHNTASTVSQEAKEVGDSESVQGGYPFLNERLEYRITPWKEFIFPEIPEGTYVVTVSSRSGSELEEKLGYFGWTYWVDGEPTAGQLQLIEYDMLIRALLLQFKIPVPLMNNYMSAEQIINFGKRLSWGWLLSREMAYPKAVSQIHETFLEATEFASPFIHEPAEFYPNATTTTRALSVYAPGGGPAGGYNSNSSTKLFYKATLALIDLLERHGIRPY